MARRKRLSSYYAEKPKERRLRYIARLAFHDVPVNISGYLHSSQETQMKAWTPEAREKFARLVEDYGRIINQRLKEGWQVKRTFWRGDKFTRGNLVVFRDAYNIHVHYLDQHLYEKEFDHRIDALEDFNRIFGDNRVLDKFQRMGEKWIV